MRLKLFVVAIVLGVILEATLTNAKKDDEDSSKEKDKKFEKSNNKFARMKKCQGKDWKPAKRLAKGFEKCTVSTGKDKREGPVCLTLCAWKEAEIIKDGKIEKEEVDKLVDELLPGELKDGREDVRKAFAKCIKKDYDEDEKDDHERCHKWYKVFTCIRTSFVDHCAKDNGKSEEESKENSGVNFKKIFGLG